MHEDRDAAFEQLFEQMKGRAPFAAGFLDWIRRPSSRLIRIPLAILLILGGIFSILPLLGIWMLPLGLLILALDVSFLRGPVTGSILWVERKWQAFKQRRKRQR